jgi:hypothetical protein
MLLLPLRQALLLLLSPQHRHIGCQNRTIGFWHTLMHVPDSSIQRELLLQVP